MPPYTKSTKRSARRNGSDILPMTIVGPDRSSATLKFYRERLEPLADVRNAAEGYDAYAWFDSSESDDDNDAYLYIDATVDRAQSVLTQQLPDGLVHLSLSIPESASATHCIHYFVDVAEKLARAFGRNAICLEVLNPAHLEEVVPNGFTTVLYPAECSARPQGDIRVPFSKYIDCSSYGFYFTPSRLLLCKVLTPE